MSIDPKDIIIEDGEDLDLIKDPTPNDAVIGEVVRVTDAIVEDENLSQEDENNPLGYIKG